MKNSEKELNNRDEIKEKIRARYKGVDKDILTVIPMKEKMRFHEDKRAKRVAAYCRVSTGDVNQTSSYELQKNYYEDMIKEHEGWELVGIYADEGISGTSLKHRDSFNRMIEDCLAGKIDLIVTKSIARFARNIVDSINTQRMLANLNPPVGVFFETEHIYSLDTTSEMMMAVLSAAAQEESHTKSEIMNISIEQRFSRGIFLTPKLLGFDLDEDGNLVINEEEADTVKLIFFMVLSGFSLTSIAEILTQLNRKTKKGNTKWSTSSIHGVIENERHCGDVLSRKTFTPDYLTHKSRKNQQDRNQYLQEDHHERIVSREVFNAANLLLKSYRRQGGLRYPILKVVQEGFLCGYVPVNLHWGGFRLEDYVYATEYAYAVAKIGKPEEAERGKKQLPMMRIPLMGYQIVRSELFELEETPVMKIKNGRIVFSNSCFEKLLFCETVELLFNAIEKKLILRAAEPGNYGSIFWYKKENDKYKSISIAGGVFIQMLYEFMEWEKTMQCRIHGKIHLEGEDAVLVFSLPESEIERGEERYYPKQWIESFGQCQDEYFKELSANIHFSFGLNLSAEAIAVEREDYLNEEELEEIYEETEELIQKLSRNQESVS